MIDKDKEAFEKWYSKETSDVLWEDFNGDEIVIKSWQSVCEYKQKEIDDLNDLVFAIETNNKSMEEQIEYLQAENAKLRECVEFYADKKSYVPRRSNSDIYSCIVGDNTIDKNRIAHAGKYARQVLKEVEEK